MKTRLTVILLFLTSFCFAQRGQTPDSLTLVAMDKINWLSGDWTGEGWIMIGTEKKLFSQEEHITHKAKGSVILIDGVGVNNDDKNIVHEAFAVISYDLFTGKYLMRAFKSDGKYVDANVKVEEDGTFIWGFSNPQTPEVRYTIRLLENKWNEIGEYRLEGGQWKKFYEMNLTKL